MTCTTCGEQPKKACNGFPKAVVEINNPEKLILFRRVDIPASMGDEAVVPPAIGKYYNTLVYYEASENAYLYSSDGIPTKLTASSGSGSAYIAGDGIDIENGVISVDTDTVQTKLTAGNSINIEDGTISVIATQTTGDSTTNVMSQSATTSAIQQSVLTTQPTTIQSSEILSGYWDTSGESPAWHSATTRLMVNKILSLEAGDTLTFQTTSPLEIGVWTKEYGDADYTNVFPYAVASPLQTIVCEKRTQVLIQFKNSGGTTIEPSDYDGSVVVFKQGIRKLDDEVSALKSDTIEIETLTSADFIKGATSLPDNNVTTGSNRLTTKFLRTANAGDILLYNSPVLEIGVWVIYRGETTPVNIIPYTATSNTQTFIFPKDVLELLIQFKRTGTGTITVEESETAEINILHAKITPESTKQRTARYECIKSVNHRGYQELAPENTLPAFKLSAEHNFEWIETDVQFTSDDVPVILHDRSINRTARNADGTAISDTVNIDSITYEQALTYDYGIWFSSEYAGTKIPTFEEMIKYCKNLGLKVRIELKSETVTTSKLPTLVDIVNKNGMIDNVEWASFGLTLLQYIATNYPTFAIGYIVSTLSATVVSNAQGLKTSTNKVTVAGSISNSDANIKLLSDAMIPLDLWTITNPAQILNANKYVSSITTNRYNAADILYGQSA